MSTIKVDTIQSRQHSSSTISLTSTGATVNGDCTATTFSGSGASLTSLPAANLTGTLPAIDGSALTGISSGITVQDEGSALSTAGTTLDFVGAGVTASGTGATKTITVPGGGGSLEFVSKTTIATSSQTTEINFSSLDSQSMYKVIVKLARMSGTGEPNIYFYRDGASTASTASYIDYVSSDVGSTQRVYQNEQYVRVYTFGYEDKNWEYEMTFSTGYHGWFRGTGHPNGNNYPGGWTHFWGHFNSSLYSTSRISGISLRHGNSRTFDTPSEIILYKIKES